jgi:MoaA/NifB/PqqE/SkfB family radical SAM enzyme
MIENTNNWPLEHWHIELCSKCSLKCPRCTRQEVPGLTNTELTLDWFRKNFTTELLQEIKKITLCGDDGDPIYAKDLISIIRYIKNANSLIQFVIVTNGSYKTGAWWQELFSCLDQNDHIHFSIDGWDHASNNLYRINSDWSSIMNAVDIASNHSVYKTWATIAFRFNENSIDSIKDIAQQKNFDVFQLTLSSKFGSVYESYPKNDPLEPSQNYVAHGRFERQYFNLSNRKWSDSVKAIHSQRYEDMAQSKDDIKALCSVGNKGLYVNAMGRFYPCCWTGLRYQHNKGLFNDVDHTKSLCEVLNDTRWNNLFESFELGICPQECKEKCSAKKFNLEHATNW